MTEFEPKTAYTILVRTVKLNTYPGKPAPTEAEVKTITIAHGRLDIQQFKSALVAATAQNYDLVRFHGPEGRPRLALADNEHLRQVNEWLAEQDGETQDGHAAVNDALANCEEVSVDV